MKMLTFLKNWTLPVAMVTGALIYWIFSQNAFLNPLKPAMYRIIDILTPLLIFAQLLLTFCKVNPHELFPAGWHWKLLSFQLFSCLAVSILLIYLPMGEEYREVFEGAMVCLICPTATAAAVITGKLGGNVSALTCYTLLSNILAAAAVPLIFPLVEVHSDVSFHIAFLKILGKVFPLLLLPFIIAFILRWFFPKIHTWLLGLHDMAFYLWGVGLAIVSGQTVRSLVTSDAPLRVEIWLGIIGLVTCSLQFFIGKRIGAPYGERISGGQALGQKNTILAIWMAYTYLNPLSSVAPGSYVLWQNLFNSWQLWKKRKNS